MEWPAPPKKDDEEELDLLKIGYQGRIDEWKAQLDQTRDLETKSADAERERAKSERQHVLEQQTKRYAADLALEQIRYESDVRLHEAFHANIAEIAKGGMERSRSGAEFVEKAAAAVAGLYTGLLGLVFVAKDNPLPSRGLIPAMFLGLAVVLAFAYLAFLKKPSSIAGIPARATLREAQEERTWFLVRWVRAGIMNKKYAIRAAVIALGFGVAFLPAPFLEFPTAAAVDDHVSLAAGGEGASTTDADQEPGTTTQPDLDWPGPPAGISEPKLAAILYEAQVDIAKAKNMELLEEKPSPSAEAATDEKVFWVVAFFALLVVLLAPVWWAHASGENKDEDEDSAPPHVPGATMDRTSA